MSPVTDAPTRKPIEIFTMHPVTLSPVVPPTEAPTEKPTNDWEEPNVYTELEPEPVAAPAPEPEPNMETAPEPEPEPLPAPIPLPFPTGKPSPRPSGKPSANPTRYPTKMPSKPPQSALPPSSAGYPVPSPETIAEIGSILIDSADGISSEVLLKIDVVTKEKSPTQLYQYGGFVNALGVMSKGSVGSMYFYLGPSDNPGKTDYGLANVAIFLAQAVIETVQFGVCDDVSWEKDVFGRYPLSNSCGQGRYVGVASATYEDSNPCSDDDAFMACETNLEMTAIAETHGIFVGAPPPLECYPSTATERFTGAWDPSLSCEQDGCNTYEGQTMGNIDPDSVPTANSVSLHLFVIQCSILCLNFLQLYFAFLHYDHFRSSAR